MNNPNAAIYDPSLLTGFGARPYNWQESVHGSASAPAECRGERRLLPHRPGARRFSATENVARRGDAISNRYCVTAPSDSRLPGGGGYQICGLYDVVPTKFGVSSTVTSKDSRIVEKYDGIDVAMDVRFPHGFLINGGLNMGKTVTNACDVVFGNPQINNFNVAANAGSTVATAPRLDPYATSCRPGRRTLR